MRHKIFGDSQFHDSFLLSLDFDDWREKISMLLWCPNAGETWEQGRYLKIAFRRLLFFGLEVSVIGEFGSTYPMLHSITLDHASKESDIWRNRIEKLARATQHYPQGIKSRRYTDVYHFIFESADFEGMAFLPGRDGFHVMCRDFEVSDVTHEMPNDAIKYNPEPIASE